MPLKAAETIELVIDLKPALAVEQLDARLQRDFKEFSRKHLANGLDKLLPKVLFRKSLRPANYLLRKKLIKSPRSKDRHW